MSRFTIPLPERIQLIDVGPRDGYQNVKTFIPTETKLKIIDAIVVSGISEIEAT